MTVARPCVARGILEGTMLVHGLTMTVARLWVGIQGTGLVSHDPVCKPGDDAMPHC